MADAIDADLAHLSAAVYARPWAAARRQVEARGWRVAATVDHAGSQALLAVTDDAAAIVLRGTEASRWRWIDILANVRLWPTPWAGHGLVHDGYATALARIRDRVRWELCECVPAGLPLYLTGHSLGGALAHLLAAWLAVHRRPVPIERVTTFGAPRALDAETADAITAPVHRYVIRGDPAPAWPWPLHGHPADAIPLPAPSWHAGPLTRHSVESYVAAVSG